MDTATGKTALHWGETMLIAQTLRGVKIIMIIPVVHTGLSKAESWAKLKKIIECFQSNCCTCLTENN